jgi:hypothetical protein
MRAADGGFYVAYLVRHRPPVRLVDLLPWTLHETSGLLLLITEKRKTSQEPTRHVALVRARNQYEHRARHNGVSSCTSSSSLLSPRLTEICIADPLIVLQPCVHK